MGDSKEREGDAGRAFRSYSRQIYRYLLRRTGSVQDAEELTQRVFTDATAAFVRGERPDSVLAWLYAVAERRFIDELRRRARASEYVDASAIEAAPREASVYGPAVADAIKRGIERLPEDQREVVIMNTLEGRSFAYIAHRVGATEGACKMRFARGIRQLREWLREEGIEP